MSTAFPMPELTRHIVTAITRDALKDACHAAGAAARSREQGKPDPDLDAWDAKTSVLYESWVNYSRSTWPEEESGFMLDYEPARYGARIPFQHGDRWDHDGAQWNIIRNGKIVKRKSVQAP